MEHLENKVRRAEETKRQVSGKRNLNRYLFFVHTLVLHPAIMQGRQKGRCPCFSQAVQCECRIGRAGGRASDCIAPGLFPAVFHVQSMGGAAIGDDLADGCGFKDPV